MKYEYYFSKKYNIDEDTLVDFLFTEQKGNKYKEEYYQVISHGWKDEFGLLPNGEAIYISPDGSKYTGIWFYVEHRRVAIFNEGRTN